MTTVPNSSIKLNSKMFFFEEITLMLWRIAVLSCQLPWSCLCNVYSQQAPLQSLKLSALQRKVLKYPCSGMAPCNLSSPTDSHEVERICGLVFKRPMQKLPALSSCSLPAGTPLPEYHTHLHTQHLAPINPHPPAPRESPLSTSALFWAVGKMLPANMH